ncbi:MAG TPA: transposase [Chondromyces sp.]|nr:transposase [Chondromyces sp.]
MARKPRIFVPHAPYHVYCRVGRGEAAFASRDERDHWLDTVREVVRDHRIKVLAWCLMSNHYHLVLRSGPAPLWRAMARIQRRISWHFNRSRGIKGRLWQSRYRAKLIRDDIYYNQALAYVHLNPVSAGLVRDPAEYRWSGHRELIGRAKHPLIDVAEALVSFGGNTAARRAAYLNHVRLVLEARWFADGVSKLPWWRVVADDEQTVEEPDAPAEAVWFDERPIDIGDGKPLPLETVAGWFEDVVPDAEGRLRSRTQRGQDAQLRRLFTVLTILEMGYRSTEVSELLNRSPSSVSRWLYEGLLLRSSDARFEEQLAIVKGEMEQRISEL